jgi:hypothetical protein
MVSFDNGDEKKATEDAEEQMYLKLRAEIQDNCWKMAKRFRQDEQEVLDHVSSLLFMRFRGKSTLCELDKDLRLIRFSAKRECLKYCKNRTLSLSEDFFDTVPSGEVHAIEVIDSKEESACLENRLAHLLTDEQFNAIKTFFGGGRMLKRDYRIKDEALGILRSDAWLKERFGNERN